MKKQEQFHKSETDLALQIKSVNSKVIMAELKKLHMQKPRGIIDEIKKIIEKEIGVS